MRKKKKRRRKNVYRGDGKQYYAKGNTTGSASALSTLPFTATTTRQCRPRLPGSMLP